MQSVSERVRGLDGLRAVAAFAIVVHHSGFWSGATFNGSWGRYLGRLDVGVPVFFALSGFLLFRPIVVCILDDKPLRPVLVHIWRRALRIYPAFWVALTLIVVFTTEHFRDVTGGVVTGLLVHIHWPDQVLGPMPQAWSLATEVSFYAALPFIARVARPLLSDRTRVERRNALYVFTLLGAIGSIAFRVVVLSIESRWSGSAVLWLPGTFDYFAVGMTLAVAREGHESGSLAREKIERWAGPAGLWWVTAGVLFHVASWHMGLALGLETASWPREIGRQFLYAAIGFCLLFPLVFGGQRRSVIRRLTQSRFMEWLGLISYSVYLWHMVFIVHPWGPLRRFVEGLVDDRFLTVLIVAVLPTIVVASFSYYLVERPAMGLQAALRRPIVDSTPGETVVRRLVGSARGASYRMQLWMIAGLGLILRVAYVLVSKRNDTLDPGVVSPGDQFYYSLAADALAAGKGFVVPWHGLTVGPEVASPVGVAVAAAPHAADHPPLTALVASPASLLPGGAGSHLLEQRLTMCVVGAFVVVAIGYLGREVAGAATGLVAAGIAAVYAGFWINDGLVMAESLTTLMVTGAVWAAFRYRRVPRLRTAIEMGIWLGLAALARSESLLLVVLVAVPVIWGTHARWDRRLLRSFAVGAACAVVIAPWVVPNLLRFDEPVLMSSNDGLTLVGANSPQTYSGGAVGFWTLEYAFSLDLEASGGPDLDQSGISRIYREEAIAFATDNLGDLPRVVGARLGRLWSVYGPLQMAKWNQGEGRELWASHLALLNLWMVAPFAAIGWWRARRERRWRWPLTALFVHVTVVGAGFYGLARFRVTAEIAMVVLAAIGVRWVTGLGTWRADRDIRGEIPDSPGPTLVHTDG